MSTPTTCPHCGADSAALAPEIYFSCDTYKGNLSERGKHCYEREIASKDARIQKLERKQEWAGQQVDLMHDAVRLAQKENTALKERIQRLEGCAAKLLLCAYNERCTCGRTVVDGEIVFDPTNCRRCQAVNEYKSLTAAKS